THLFSSDAPPTTAIYPLSLHYALPILENQTPLYTVIPQIAPGSPTEVASVVSTEVVAPRVSGMATMHWSLGGPVCVARIFSVPRSEEHTSELQSRSDLVCRLLLEKKKI